MRWLSSHAVLPVRQALLLLKLVLNALSCILSRIITRAGLFSSSLQVDTLNKLYAVAHCYSAAATRLEESGE